MLYLVIFLLLLAVITISLLYLVKVTITVKYKLKNLDDVLYVNISVLGGIFSHTVYYSDGKKEGKEKKENKDGNIDSNAKESLLDGIMDKFRSIRRLYEIIKKINIYLMKKLEVVDFSIDMDFGAGDAAATGILGGVAWMVIGALEAFFCSNFNTKKHSMKVKPNFNQMALNVKVNCIFRIKIVYIILVAIKYFIYQRKMKKIKGGGVNGKSASY